VLEIAVLGLLNESPMHGYELRKRLSTLLGAFRAFSYGSLYPTLRRLSEAGWISEEAPIDAASNTRSRRGKRVYRLTADGKEHFAELLAEVGPDAFDDEGFGARLAFFAQTRSDIRLQILEGRRRRVEELPGPRRRPAGPLHARVAGARTRVGGPRGPLAQRTDRERADRFRFPKRSTKPPPVNDQTRSIHKEEP
jgi:DNA-binding PadR family transcriptional regulator